MKFSIAFKYSNVTFKNKETKETVTYDSKAEGNSFAFDNVDEDVVIGIVKGIKNRKASDLFSFDNFRTNFINVLARNKCKELYDKLDKGEWKIEDVAVSNITIKDLEFTKPTMNAREAITVESMKRKPRLNGVVCINWEWSSEYGDTDSGEDQIPVPDTSEETIKRAVRKFCNKKDEWDEVGGHSDNVYLEVFLTDYGMGEPEFLFDGSFAYGDIKWFDNDGKGNHKYTGETYIDEASEDEELKMDFQEFADFINTEFKKKVLAKVDSNGEQVRLEVYPNEKRQIEEILKDVCEQNGWKYENVTRRLHYTYYVTKGEVVAESLSPKFKEGDKVSWYDPKDETILHGGVVTDVYDNISYFMYKVWFEDEELSEVIDEEDLDYDTLYESKNMKTLNTTREHFQESQYYTRKYGKLAFVSESGKEFKTDKGYIVEFKGE